MAYTLVTPGNIADLSPDSYAVHPFDAMSESIVNLAGTLMDNSNMSDRASLSVSYTESGRDAVAIVPEGKEISETPTVFKNVTVPSVKLAALKVASNEVVRHTNTPEQTASRIQMQAMQDLRDAADAAVFGVTQDVEGMPAVPMAGITELGGLTDNLDWLADALANIMDNGGREENAVIVASPRANAALMKLKDSTNGNRPLIDTLSATSDYAIPNTTGMGRSTVPVRHLAGIPILISNNLRDPAAPDSSGELYILDRPNLLIAATEVEVATSKDSAFARDSTSYRATMRLGWKLARPERVSVVSADSLPEEPVEGTEGTEG